MGPPPPSTQHRARQRPGTSRALAFSRPRNARRGGATVGGTRRGSARSYRHNAPCPLPDVRTPQRRVPTNRPAVEHEARPIHPATGATPSHTQREPRTAHRDESRARGPFREHSSAGKPRPSPLPPPTTIESHARHFHTAQPRYQERAIPEAAGRAPPAATQASGVRAHGGRRSCVQLDKNNPSLLLQAAAAAVRTRTPRAPNKHPRRELDGAARASRACVTDMQTSDEVPQLQLLCICAASALAAHAPLGAVSVPATPQPPTREPDRLRWRTPSRR